MGIKRPSVVTAIIAVTVCAFLLQLSGGVAINAELGQYNPAVRDGEWWRLLTAAFLHVGFIHLGFNMYVLYLLGPSLETRLGSIPFAALYLASALAGSAAFLAFGNPGGRAMGASGAIFGLFGAWIGASYRSRNMPGGAAQFRSFATLLALNLALPLLIPGIAWQAHLGGLVAGLVIIYAWMALPSGPTAVVQRTAVALAVAALSVSFAFWW